MSLSHPIIEPQIALNACTGYFLGGDDRYIALLYSDRIVFHPIDEDSCQPVDHHDEDIVVSIPQPPMTLGNSEIDVMPNMGHLFCSVGRNHDMLALQFRSTLMFLSVNQVDQVLELQGCWGLWKAKDQMNKVPSAVSLASYVEHPHVPKLMRPQLGHRTSSNVPTLTSFTSGAHSHSMSLPQQEMSALGLSKVSPVPSINSNTSSSQLTPPHQQQANRPKLCISNAFPTPQASPDGTQVFLVTVNKYGTIVLVIVSCFGQELLKMECEYLNVLTFGWISDDIVFIVYLNQNFHKKFQTFRLRNKMKNSGLFGMGKKSVKPSFSAEINVPLAVDFLPSVQGMYGGPNLVFKEYVLLGTKTGGYVRVNYRSASWEPVSNARNIVGAVRINEVALIVQAADPMKVEQISLATISESALHALKVEPEVRDSLCSRHSVGGDLRFSLQLLHLGQGLVLDYKRHPFRLYKFSRSRQAPPLQLLPWLGPNSLVNHTDAILRSSKLTEDFLVKTELALYTRDPNGDDSRFCKIMNRDSIYFVELDREGLLRLVYRDIKSVWAVFMQPTEIRVLDESHSKPAKVRTKATFKFDYPYTNWKPESVTRVSRNILLLNMVRKGEWATFLVSFVNATFKVDPTPPTAVCLLESKSANEAPASMLQCPGTPYKWVLQVFDKARNIFSRQYNLYLSSSANYRIEETDIKVVPTILDEYDNFTFFTEFDGPLDGMYLAGVVSGSSKPTTPRLTPPPLTAANSATDSPDPSPKQSPAHTPLATTDAKIKQVLAVESTNMVNSCAFVFPHKDYLKSCIWLFDSDGAAFRELTVQDIPQYRLNRLKHYEQKFKKHQRLPKAQKYELAPEFERKQFIENTRDSVFRPVPEIDAVTTRGIGAGLDAEVYLKSPDDGFFTIFRIQNKKLLESLSRLEKVVLEKIVGAWLPEELKTSWIEEFQSSTMVSGTVFSVFWRLSDERKQELCAEADVAYDFMVRIRPP